MSDLPGLPDLPSDVSDLFETVIALTADALGIGVGSSPQWGIFLNGDPVILADGVLTVEVKQDYSISSYPVEQGAFASYNKVQRPIETRFQFATGGSVSDRQAFLNSIAAIIGDTNLYDVVTPEAIYPNQNLIHQDYRRSAHEGLGLLVVDITCQEVRPASLATSTTTTTSPDATATETSANSTPENPAAAIGQPQSPGDTSLINGGNQQPQTPTTLEQNDATRAMANGPYRGPHLIGPGIEPSSGS